MKTFVRPSINAEGAADSVDTGSEFDYVYRRRRGYPKARRIAVLSIIPGLGELRNGEMAKALLFLTVTVSNAVLIFVLLSADTLKEPLAALAKVFNHQPNWQLIEPLQHGMDHGPVLVIYVALLAAFVAYAVRDAYDHAVIRLRNHMPLPRARFTLPEATSGSYLVHVAVIVSFALVMIVFIAPQQPAQQVTQIDLVQEKPKAAKKASPPPKRQAPPKVQPKPIVKPQPVVKPVEHPKVMKVEKPKPTPVAVAVPTKEPAPLQLAPVEAAAPPPAPVAAAASPVGGTGSGTDTGNGPGGQGEAEVDMGPYMRDLQRRIKAHWYPPKGNENKRIKVSFKVYKDGHITRLKLTSSSGVGIADDAAMQAVQDAAPFMALPTGAGDDIDINFTFDYHVFGSGGGHGL